MAGFHSKCFVFSPNSVSLPEGDDDVGDGPTDDEGDGAVERHLGDVRHARRQPDVGQRNLK